MELTVTVHFCKAILQTLREQTSQPIPAALSHWLNVQKDAQRLPLSSLDELWRECYQVSGDALFGLRAGLNVQPGNFGAICQPRGDQLFRKSSRARKQEKG